MSPAPAGGPGTYPTVADAASTVVAALITACQTALTGVVDADLVKVVPGYYFPQLALDQVTVEFVSSSTVEGPASTHLRTHHELTLQATFDVERVTDDQSVTVGRALALMAAVETYVNVTSPTLDGAVVWCRMAESRTATSTDQTSSGDGMVTEIQATFTARVIVRNV